MDRAAFDTWKKDVHEKEADWGAKEHWDSCKEDLIALLTDELIFDTAVFMRCQLNITPEM